MPNAINLKSADFYLISLIVFAAVVGDVVVSHTRIHLYQAIFDNATHAIISGLSWLIFVLHYRSRFAFQSLLEIFIATLTASLIDLDHFIAAKSIHLKDATNLQSRPFLHCSTIPIVLTAFLYAFALFSGENIFHRYAFLIFLSFASHHTRDATRRGYWFYPFGSTPPIPYFIYVNLSWLLPYLTMYVYQAANPKYANETFVI